MVALEHKSTNAPLILIVCDVTFCILAKHIIGNFSRFFEEASTCWTPKIALRCAKDNLEVEKVLAPSKKPIKIADHVFCTHKKITSRTITNSGAFIVKKAS